MVPYSRTHQKDCFQILQPVVYLRENKGVDHRLNRVLYWCFPGLPIILHLFLAVFNPCLDLLDQSSHLGYCISKSDITSSAKAYADDLTLIVKNQEGCQQLINTVDDFLKRTRTMKAKPLKCKSHAMKKFVPSQKQKQDGHTTQYVAYEPQLEIDGKQITYIHSQPIRFLGKVHLQRPEGRCHLTDGQPETVVNAKHN